MKDGRIRTSLSHNYAADVDTGSILYHICFMLLLKSQWTLALWPLREIQGSLLDMAMLCGTSKGTAARKELYQVEAAR